MNKKELKKVIKEMVRESLLEIFAEMKLESIVEGVVRKQTPTVQTTKVVSEQKKYMPTKTGKPSKQELMQKMGLDEDAFANFYGDIDMENNPIVTGDKGDTNPELVSEEALEKSGLFRDYSHLI